MKGTHRRPSRGRQGTLPLVLDGDRERTPEPVREPMPEPDCPHALAGKLPKPRKRIISASKRTDIPAFYLGWMRERVRAGWVDVPNPMFRRAHDELKRLTHVSLRPEHVIAVVWWSKNYAVYERMHEAFACYPRQFFHFTINPRREDLAWIEPDVPPVEEALRQIQFLADLKGGPGMVAWRYDPIMFWREEGRDRSSWDPAFFEHMCRELTKLGVRRCYTSLADRYRKFEQRIERFFPHVTLRDPDGGEVAALAKEMAEIAGAFGMQVFSCTEATLAMCAGFRKGSCIDGPLLGGSKGRATDQKMRGREECACTLHADIGDYVEQECGYSCVYCYANPNHRRFEARRAGTARQAPSSEEGPADAGA